MTINALVQKYFANRFSQLQVDLDQLSGPHAGRQAPASDAAW